MSEKLKSLLTDLGRDSNLESQYKEDRESVMSQYALNDDEKELLRNEDTDGIKSKLSLDSGVQSIQKVIKVP